MKNVLVAAIVGALAFGCSQGSPTAPSMPSGPGSGQNLLIESPQGSDEATVEQHRASLRAMLEQMRGQGQRGLAEHDSFTCENVEEVRVRFSDPGFIDALDVGMFVKFVGIPAGTKTLRIWWDYENNGDLYQDIPVGDGDVNPEDPSVFDVEDVIEHSYVVPGEKQVRIELILQGQTGNCARNRDIIVTSESFDHVASSGGLGACNTFGGMGLLVNFNPPIPAGTPYTVRARVDAAGIFGPVFAIVGFSNTAGPDIVFPPPAFGPLPAEFTNQWTPSVDHRQLLVAAQLGAIPTSMNIRIVSISVPGKTVGVSGTLAATCP